ncbi:MAG: hypothetical protein JW850_03625 [Thermoflexales bacterium]|nr:hypothetical protein [Thermoflexales bacterium]
MRLSVMTNVSLALALAALLALASCNVTLDGRGLNVRDPVRDAQATRVAQAAHDEAARRAVDRQILEAQRDQVRAEAQAAQNAVPATTLRNVLISTGIGAGALVLAVGSAFAVVALLNKRATSVYPNGAGQYPIIARRGFGWITYHDPNRGLGPAAVYRTPTLLDVVATTIVAIRSGKPPALTAPAADFPPTADTGTMAQIASQAQAVGLMAAATRNQEPNQQVRRLAETVARSTLGTPTAASRLPGEIKLIDDPEQIAAMQEMFALEAPDGVVL